MCMEMMSQSFNWRNLHPYEIVTLLFRIRKSETRTNGVPSKEMVEGCMKGNWRGWWRIQWLWSRGNVMWPWELGAISGIACQSTAHHLLSAGQMMGNKHTVPGATLNSLNFHPGLIHGPDLKIIALLPPCLWIPATTFSSTLASLPRSLWLRSLLVHLSSTVSSPVSATPSSVLTHGLSRKIINAKKEDEWP